MVKKKKSIEKNRIFSGSGSALVKNNYKRLLSIEQEKTMP
jgi:hypothetical protein